MLGSSFLRGLGHVILQSNREDEGMTCWIESFKCQATQPSTVATSLKCRVSSKDHGPEVGTLQPELRFLIPLWP